MTVLILLLTGLLIPVEPGESIQEALDSAAPGDTVQVMPGVHTGTGDNLLVITGDHNGVILLGDPADPSSVVLSGEGLTGGILNIDGLAAGTVDTTTVISGLSFSGGSADPFGGAVYTGHASPSMEYCEFTGCTADNGGAIYSWKGAPRIRYCGFTLNECSSAGAGVYLYSSDAVIEHCRFTDCKSWDDGGGIYCYHSSPVIFNCLFSGGYAHDDGGGVYCFALSDPVISFCTFTDNFALYTGSAVYFRVNSSPVISHCIVTENLAPAFYIQDGGDPAFMYNCVWGNPDGDYGNLPDPTGTAGNISEDPLLTGDWYLSQTAAGQTENSPCVNAGEAGSASFGLEMGWTRSDSIPDTLTVDLGFHHTTGCSWQSSQPDQGRHGLLIYPNPTAVSFTVVCDAPGNWNLLEIFDLSGRVVFTGPLGSDTAAVSTEEWGSTGIYLVRVSGQGNSVTGPLTLIR